MNISKSFRVPMAAALAAGLLPFLAACGSTSAAPGSSGQGAAGQTAAARTAAASAGQVAVPADADPATKKLYLSENDIAACMKKAGFVYHPDIATDSGPQFGGVEASDYALAKKYREKYGFGFYSGDVYPSDPNAQSGEKAKEQASTPDPNAAYVSELTPAQRYAYEVAREGKESADAADKPPTKRPAHPPKLGGCEWKADVAVYGPDGGVPSTAKVAAAEKADQAAINGDPQLVALAQSYASCLSGHGIQVTTTQPTGIASMVDDAENAKVGGSAAGLSVAKATPLLTQEITLAMQDLECGKAFRAAFFPKLAAHPDAAVN